eukprot:3390753-Prymnesium_polylepis.1
MGAFHNHEPARAPPPLPAAAAASAQVMSTPGPSGAAAASMPARNGSEALGVPSGKGPTGRAQQVRVDGRPQPPLKKQPSAKLQPGTPIAQHVRDMLMGRMKRVIDTFHEWDTDHSQTM